MRTLRASEIASFLYCQRAWWYQKNGYTPQNQADLDSGLQWHQRHGRRVMTSVRLRILAYGLIFLALLIAGLAFLSQAL
jgi:hypothetical protein